MMKSYCLAFLILVFFPCGKGCFAQIADTSFVATASTNAVKKYREFIRGQSGLYSGTEYNVPRRTNDDHPFYRDYDWFEAKIQYNGEYYDDIHLMYDITSDNVIIEHFYNGEDVMLIRAKVENFTLGNERFVHLNGTSFLPGLPTPGFYQELYDGKSRLLARHVKFREEKVESTAVEVYFTPKTRFYLLKDGNYHRVSSRADVLKLFRDKKQALKQYAASQGLRFTKDDPAPFAAMVRYYDSLNPETR